MVQIKARLKTRRDACRVQVQGRLTLPFEQRQKSRLRTRLDSGEEVALMLPRGEILRGGDLVSACDGRVFEVAAALESLAHIESASLAKVAYHLGNRHVPVEVGDGFLRIAEDRVLEEMVRGLGAKISRVAAPFEPEGGAYHGHAHAQEHDHRHDHPH